MDTVFLRAVNKNLSHWVFLLLLFLLFFASDYQIRCRPAHGFHHVLSMTGNISEFTRVMKRQRISANVDTPEGGLDAMLQAAVCQVNNALSHPSDAESGICAGTIGSILTQRCVLLQESRLSNDTTAHTHRGSQNDCRGALSHIMWIGAAEGKISVTSVVVTFRNRLSITSCIL